MVRDDTAQREGPPARSKAAPLEFRDVTKRYAGADHPAVDSLSLKVPAGEICVLVGPSGCGKTTAMRLVNRMIPITSGDILLIGHSTSGELSMLALGGEDGLLQAVVEERPIGQVGQRIVERLVLEQLGLRLAVADVQHPNVISRCGIVFDVGQQLTIRAEGHGSVKEIAFGQTFQSATAVGQLPKDILPFGLTLLV